MLCFVHIERTGGTTLHATLRNNAPLRYLTLSPNEGDVPLTAWELKQLLRLLPMTTGLGGHNTRSWLGYEAVVRDELQYLTFVRDPIARYKSHYSYQREAMGFDWTIEAFLADDRFHDFQTTRICGKRDADAARRELDRFAFVGLTEQFEPSLLLFRHALGLGPGFDLRHERLNARRGTRPDPRLEDEDVLEWIRDRNRLDTIVHAHVRDELFPRFREAYGPGLDADVDVLVAACRDYRVSRRRRVPWRAWRGGVYRNLEYALWALARTRERFSRTDP